LGGVGSSFLSLAASTFIFTIFRVCALCGVGFLAFVLRPLQFVVLRIEKGLAQLRGQTHARGWELALVETAFVAALIAGEVQRHGIIADQEHLGGVGSGKLNERILAGQGVSALGSDYGIGDAVHARYRDQSRLRVERLGSVHVGHNLVAHLDQIIGHLFGRNFRKAQLRFGIDEAGIDGHAGGVDDLRTCGNIDGIGGAYCGDFSGLHYNHAVFNHAVGYGEDLAAF